MHDRLINTREASKLLSVSMDTIRSLVKRKVLDGVDLNKDSNLRPCWRIRLSSIERLITDE